MATSTVRILFTGNATSATRSVSQLEKAFTGVGTAAKFASLGIVAGLAASTKAAVEFDREMRNVNSISKLNEKQFKATSKAVLGLAKETAQAPKTLAKGLYDIVSSGFKANDAIKILRVSAKAATAGLTDTATATKAINAALNAYHLQATDARKVSDVLFQTVNKGVLTFEELAQNMGDLVPAAAPLGVSLEEVGAAIATITLQGVPAAEAATRVKNTMLQLASPSKELTKLLSSNGFASGEAAIKARGFVGVLQLLNTATHGNVTATAALTPEIRSLLGVVGLTGKNLDTYLANLKSMKAAQNGAGATAAAFAEQGKSISFQWQQAKAALTAAAIPLGQQLFPLLSAGAGKVQEFAEALPELQAQFSGVTQEAGRLAGALGAVGRSSEGQAGIVGIGTAIIASKSIGKLSELRAGLSLLASPAGIAAGAIGILAGGLYYAATRANYLERSLVGLKQAMSGQASAAETLQQTQLRAAQAETAVEAATLNVTQARRQASAIAKQYGRDSEQYKSAAIQVKQAEQTLTQAHYDNARAKRDLQRAGQNLKDATVNQQTAIAQATDTATAALKKAEGSYYGTAESAQKNLVPVKKALDQYGAGIRAADAAAGKAVGSTDQYKAAVQRLYDLIGKLPTYKQIRIDVQTTIAERTLKSVMIQNSPGSGRAPVKRASGGFIPMLPGAVSGADSVAAMLTPGEIVLNRSQQNALGGPRFLAQLFGFTGSEGPGFATGGIVGSPISQLGRRRPPRAMRGRNYRSTNAAARAALVAVTAVNQRQTNLDRAYGQLSRKFSLTDEQFIVSVTGPDGTDIEQLDAGAVSARLAEIDQLLASRAEMIRLVDREKAELQVAIAKLRVAIQNLLAAIRAENEAAQADARRIRDLARQIGANDNATAKARKGGKPGPIRDATVAALEKEGRRLQAAKSGVEKSQQAHQDKAQRLGGTVSDFRTAIQDAQANLLNSVPYDRRDVELDMMELRMEADSVRAVKPRAAQAPTVDTGGSSGGGDALSIVPTGGGDQSALIQYLTEQLGQARFALGVQNVQLPILGAFQKGTIHLPADGLYYGHAGEQITPAGVNRGPMEQAWQGTRRHEITLDLGDKVNQLVDRRVIELTPDISLRIGREASRLAREGSY